ncbi:MAG: penicillin acylase family protein [Pirellulaceae bacterium]|nr:penicillin acylase family protein [Pirellulaceae bacterium]
MIALISVTAIYALLRGSLPQTRGQVEIKGLAAKVAIRFDDQQRPFVQAQTAADALAAQGWLHAQHRLWQMEMFRRAGQARLSELLGGSMLGTDQQLLRIGVPQLARQLEKNATTELLQYIDAYLTGVNTAIEQLRTRPVELLLLMHRPQNWTRADVFAVGAVMAYQSAGNMHHELLRFELSRVLTPGQLEYFLSDGSETAADYPYVLPRQELSWQEESPPVNGPAGLSATDSQRAQDALSKLPSVALAIDALSALDAAVNLQLPRLSLGSNGWCVAPGRSATGHALFAFDSHDELGLPNLFYEVHLFFGDGRQIRGWSAAGLPGVINGYNHRIAWGFTNIGDTQDLFLETRHPENPDQFLDGQQWYTAEKQEYLIPVSGRMDAERFTVISTRNGPLISEHPPISLRWTAHHIGDMGLEALLELNFAEDWQQFTGALDRLAAPSLNATYADVDGNIGFRTAGLLPNRAAGSGVQPLQGHDMSNRWLGMVSPTDHPRLFNPPAGYVAAANARVNAAGQGPLVSADNAAAYRIARIQSVLACSQTISVDQMRKLQVDRYDGQAAKLLPALLNSTPCQTLSEPAQEACQMLKKWQTLPMAAADSAAALIFQAWYVQLATEAFRQPLGDSLFASLLRRGYMLNHALDRLLLEEASTWWPRGKAQHLAAALERTVTDLMDRLGPELKSWRLDQLQKLTLQHELATAAPPLEMLLNESSRGLAGGPSTVGRAGYRYDRPFQVSHGATVRVVIEMAAPPQAQAIMPAGQSGHPLSRQYTDQLDNWLDGTLQPIAATADTVLGDSLELIPARDK